MQPLGGDDTGADGEPGELVQLAEGHLEPAESRQLLRRLAQLHPPLDELGFPGDKLLDAVHERFGPRAQLLPGRRGGQTRRSGVILNPEEAGNGVYPQAQVRGHGFPRAVLRRCVRSLRDELEAPREAQVAQYGVHVGLHDVELDLLHPLGEQHQPSPARPARSRSPSPRATDSTAVVRSEASCSLRAK